MKYLSLLCLVALVGCSSTKKGDNARVATEPSDVSPSSFNKEKALSTKEVKDFYSEEPKSLSPALLDETLDRTSKDELKVLKNSKDPLIEIAISCKQKDFKHAFVVIDKSFNRYQKIPAYWNLVANCHLMNHSNRKALLFYNKALEVSPHYVPALNNIGVLYSRQGEDQKALVAFEKANKQSRFSKTPRYNLAKTYLRYGLAELALPLFQGLLNESSNDVDLLNAVANSYFMTGDYQKARSYFSRIPNEQLGNAEIGINYAVTMKKLGQDDAAQKIYSNIDKPKSRSMKSYYSTVGNQLGVR
jgi:tetratricopeptide (TPR) repeat protein